jgi:hypothetical protein
VSLQQDFRNVEPAPSIAKLPLIGVVALAIVSGLFGGVVGLLMVGVMWWTSSNPWVRDDPDSHGISEQDSSRLGGFIIAVGYIVFALLSSDQFVPSNELGQGFRQSPGVAAVPRALGSDCHGGNVGRFR